MEKDAFYPLLQDGIIHNLYTLPKGFVIKRNLEFTREMLEDNPFPNLSGVTIDGDLDISGLDLTELPDLSKVIVKGSFDCSGNRLKNLKGLPETIAGDCNCGLNRLETLEGCQNTSVGYRFIVDGNPLEQIDYFPKYVAEHCILGRNLEKKYGLGFYATPEKRSITMEDIQSATGLDIPPRPTEERIFYPVYQEDGRRCDINDLPEGFELNDLVIEHRLIKKLPDLTHLKIKNIKISKCYNLKSLEGLPHEVGFLDCSDNQLPDLKGCPKIIRGNFRVDGNPLERLDGMPENVGGGCLFDTEQQEYFNLPPRTENEEEWRYQSYTIDEVKKAIEDFPRFNAAREKINGLRLQILKSIAPQNVSPDPNVTLPKRSKEEKKLIARMLQDMAENSIEK